MYEIQNIERSVTLIWPLNVIQCHKGHDVYWNIIYDFVYVCHNNISHSTHRFWDISPNIDAKGQYWTFMTLKIHSTPFEFEDNSRTTLKDAIILDGMYVLLNKIKCLTVKL